MSHEKPHSPIHAQTMIEETLSIATSVLNSRLLKHARCPLQTFVNRHRRGLPVRGQQTQSNARTRKGPKKTVAGKKGVKEMRG